MDTATITTTAQYEAHGLVYNLCWDVFGDLYDPSWEVMQLYIGSGLEVYMAVGVPDREVDPV